MARNNKFAILLLGCGLAVGLLTLLCVLAKGRGGEFLTPRNQDSAASNESSPESVRQIFQTRCAACHAAEGDGRGRTARILGLKMEDFRDCRSMSRFSDEVLFSIIKDGAAPFGRSAAMAGWRHTLSDKQIREMVGYVRSFCRERVSPLVQPPERTNPPPVPAPR